MTTDPDQIFVGLVQDSWRRYNEGVQNTHLDELFVGAVISSTVEQGYSLIDLTSNGVAHFLRFEYLPTKQRLIFQLHNLSEDLVAAKVLGRQARVVIGYGELISNAAAVFQALQAEAKSSALLDTNEPGVITCDADLATGYIYTQISLLFDLDQYLSVEYQVNYQLLQQHISATVHALSKYLRGRLGA